MQSISGLSEVGCFGPKIVSLHYRYQISRANCSNNCALISVPNIIETLSFFRCYCYNYYYYGQQPTELNTQLINSIGTSKYIQTMGKTCNAPQITLTQKHTNNTYRSFPHARGYSSSHLRYGKADKNRFPPATLDMAPPIYAVSATPTLPARIV